MILPYIYDVDISQPLLPTVLQPMMVTGDKLANRIGVRLRSGAQPYTPDGSCRGYVLRADGATVPILNGVVNGNEMYIDLPEAAYAVQGSVVISIVCVTSTAITTLFLGSGTVNRSQTDVVIDPGTVIDDISTLIQEIETAVASIPADYSDLLAAIAPVYADLTFPVSKGQPCWYEGILYKAKQDITTSESWTAAHWEMAVLGEDLADVGQQMTDIAPIFSASAVYEAGDLVWYNGRLYRADQSHTGAWNAYHFTATCLNDGIKATIGGNNAICLRGAEKIGNNRFVGERVGDALADHIGDTISVSFDLKASVARRIKVYAYQSIGYSIEDTAYFTPSTTEYTRFSFVTKAKNYGEESGYDHNGMVGFYDETDANTIYVKNFKIELGSIATPWAMSAQDALIQNAADIADLKSAINAKVSTQQMQECDLVEVPKSPNLWNKDAAENGYLHKNGTNYTGGTYDNYCHGSIGLVEEGDILNFYRWTGSAVSASEPTFVVCYNNNGDVMADAGTSGVDTFTVPSGVAEVKITVTDTYGLVYMVLKNNSTVPTELIPYYEASEYYVAKKGFIHSAFVEESADIMSAETTDEGKFLKAKTIADGKVTEWEFDEAGATGDFVEKNGTNQVTPKNLQIMEKTYSPNLIDETKTTNGTYIPKNGVSDTGNYKVTDYIPVEAGEKYYFTWLLNNASRVDGSVRFLACYNSSKEIMPSVGSDSAINSFPMTIAEGVSYVRLSFSNNAKYTKYQFEKGETPTPYYAYGTILSAIINDQYLPDEPVDMADIPAFQLVDGQNLLNQEDPDFVVGFLYTGGTVDATMTSYRISGYIAVTPGDHLMGSYVSGGGSGYTAFRTVAAYNSGKTVINASGAYNLDSNAGYYVPSGVGFVRICYAYGSYGDNVQICKTDSNRIKPYVPYAEPHYELKEDYLAPSPSAPEHVYLPEEVYVAVGRTIEFYNEQIVLDYEKYYFQWKCAKGYADKRKFSITGASTGNVNLTLTLYDNKMNICWVGACTIHVVAASDPEVKILPIGDSLTRGKAWLPETMLLSTSNIEWLGTRYSNSLKDSENNTYATIHHEGRSGWSAGDYLADTTYTEDNNYDGVGTVEGSANPFWDGSKFSLNHYLTTQTGIDTPDAVQIFLGTNDLTVSVQTAIDNIVEMVTTIRDEYEDLPIFVCNTIFRSNQNGYGSTGDDAYAGAGAGANAFQYEQDIRVMDLMEGLRTELRTMTGVYLIPLASCMDREYDFGQVMTKVNPRSTVEVAMPSESVHPQVPGYYQMADVMYSFYCGVLAE